MERAEHLPDPETLGNIQLSCNDQVFFEVLMGNIKNELLSFQSWLKKLAFAKKRLIINRINTLKGDFLINSNEISVLEDDLRRILDNELSIKVNAMKLFEGLSAEKPNSLFLSIGKKKIGDSLSLIRNDNDGEFSNSMERENYIVNFYEKLYKKPDNEQVDFNNCIENFLGPDICNSDIVTNSKLTEPEKNELDRPLTLEEFDEAVIEGNARSAPGIDGLSLPIIRICWPFIRRPFLKYINYCIGTGELSENFRGASIRLIPKKENPTQLKNWRPISLLSNMYKLFSRVINNRLKKIINRICSRSQKGFNSDRFTQEAVINVWESIAYCKQNNIRGAILAMDMEKAFDSISHGFLDEVYRFFGLGPYLTSLLKLAGNNRYASIITDSGNNSRSFKLDRGRPQGDIISPTTFNFCIQILLFKLELEPNIKKIPRLVPEVQNIVVHDFFIKEAHRESSKTETLADDNTAIMLMDIPSLRTTKNILEQFEQISGLRCNVNKTVLMPIFDVTAEESREINDLGFEVSDKFTLLGFKICRTLDNVEEIFNEIKTKIINLVAFWDRFRLSLPGRITIMKTCLISQLCYIGCVLPAPTIILGEIQQIIDNFVKKNLRCSSDRIYLEPKRGGMGCIELSNFLNSQNLSWLVRSQKLCIDNWRFDLRANAPLNNLLTLRSCDLDCRTFPLLHNIAKNFDHFYPKFCAVNENFRQAYVFRNELFVTGRHNTQITEETFGGEFFELYKGKIRNLKLSDFFREGRMLSIESLTEWGLPITAAIWFRLQSVAVAVWRKHKKNELGEQGSITIEDFFGRLKGGSKKIRKILEHKQWEETPVNDLRVVRYFAELTDTNIPMVADTQSCMGIWAFSSLDNQIREFMFKLRNNQLMLNNRRNAFDVLHDPRCTFCKIRDPDTEVRDSFAHVFFDCVTTKRLLEHFLTNVGPVPGLNTVEFRQLYWYGIFEQNLVFNATNLFVFDIFRYLIWKNKTRRKIPNPVQLMKELKFIVFITCEKNSSLRAKIQTNNLMANLLPAMG